MKPESDFSLEALHETDWSLDDTMHYLTANPLPADFHWPHRDFPAARPQPVHPKNRIHYGYGKWLRETPYFPGLFERIHGIIIAAGSDLPDPETIAAELHRKYGRATQN